MRRIGAIAAMGKKVLPEKKLLEVHIDKGMAGGQTIQFSGESDQAPGAQTGDVVIVIEEKPHDRFKRQDTDLITEIEVDLLTALGGGQLAIKHLDDRALLINLVPGEIIKHGEMKVIHGQGMPSKRHHEPGDLFVKFSVKFPDHIDPVAVTFLEKALPTRKPIDKFPKHVLMEEVDLDEVDARSKAHTMQDDPMDGEYQDGEPRVQCANQ